MTSDIDAMYRFKAVLWVEDPETRTWLDAVWIGLAPTIKAWVAGGRSNVEAVCKQALDAGHKHVFGLVDQDFGTSNRGSWATLQPVERVYRLDVHETENLLIDPAALAGCSLNTSKRKLRDIDARLTAEASRRVWWVACMQFLRLTKEAIDSGYPKNRNDAGSLSSLAEAEAYVLGSPWFTTTASTCPYLADAANVGAGLQAAHGIVSTELADGSWRRSFPGKELFRHASSYVQRGNLGPTGHLDLVKSVSEWQRANGLVPDQATELRQELLRRV